MFSDGVMHLVQQGVVTGAKKTSETGLVTGSFAVGSKELYDFMDNNPGERASMSTRARPIGRGR